MKKRRLLTIDDLVHFCQDQKVVRFSSKQSGYPIAVQIPTVFKIDEFDNEDSDNHRGMIKLKIRIFHTGLNRNGSYVSKEAANEAAPTIADRPILAAIHQLDDGSWDFEAHNAQITENENGEEEIDYIEKQIGSFSSETPFWEHDDELDKDYLCAYAYIPEEYTKAADIIRNKNGWTKNSCELTIENLAYNAKEKYLDLKKFYLSASTLLGSYDDGTKVEEGMLGSRADMVNFSKENNSIKFESNDELKQIIQSSIQEAFNNINNLRKEENQMSFDENATVIESPEEEVAFEEEVISETETQEAEAEQSTEEVTEIEDNQQESEDVTPSEDIKFSKQFEISHEDIRCALYALLTSFEEEDNEWYYITSVYDDSFVYEGMFNADNKYKQHYIKDGDNIAFDGERIHMNVEYLTDNELTALNAMRSNYEEISEKLAKYEAEPEKVTILESEDYAQIRETEEYSNLAKRETYFELDKEELSSKLDEILLNYAKQNKLEFAAKTEGSQNVTMKRILTIEPKNTKGRYGRIFSK